MVCSPSLFRGCTSRGCGASLRRPKQRSAGERGTCWWQCDAAHEAVPGDGAVVGREAGRIYLGRQCLRGSVVAPSPPPPPCWPNRAWRGEDGGGAGAALHGAPRPPVPVLYPGRDRRRAGPRQRGEGLQLRPAPGPSPADWAGAVAAAAPSPPPSPICHSHWPWR